MSTEHIPSRVRHEGDDLGEHGVPIPAGPRAVVVYQRTQPALSVHRVELVKKLVRILPKVG